MKWNTCNEWIEMNQLTRKNNEGIAKWKNRHEGTKSRGSGKKELKWRELKWRELKWMNECMDEWMNERMRWKWNEMRRKWNENEMELKEKWNENKMKWKWNENEMKWKCNEQLEINDLTWMTWHEGTEMNEVAWMNWHECNGHDNPQHNYQGHVFT